MIALNTILSRIEDYLNNSIDSQNFVIFIDNLVSEDIIYDMDEVVQSIVLRYQDMLALYVEDPIKRMESSEFFGPERLRNVVMDLKKELERVIDSSQF